MSRWIRVSDAVEPRPIAALTVTSLDPHAADERLGTVDEFGILRIPPRADGRPWELSIQSLNQALWEVEDRLRDLDDPFPPMDLPTPRTRVRKPRKSTTSA